MGFFNDPSVQSSTHLSIIPSQLASSLVYLFWHPDFSHIAAAVARDWRWSSTVALVITAALSVRLIVGACIGRSSESDRESGWEGPIWLLLVSLTIAAPTVLLESSSPIWGPGLRSEMLYAAFTPSIILGLIALMSARWTVARRTTLLCLSASVLAGLVFTASVEQNRQGQAMTAWESHLARGLQPISEASPGPIHFIVLNTSGLDYVPPEFGDRFVQAALNRPSLRWSNQSSPSETTMRIIEPATTPGVCTEFCRVTFKSDADGVTGALFGSGASVPYASVRTVRFDGLHVTQLGSIAGSDLTTFRADLDRAAPATFSTPETAP